MRMEGEDCEDEEDDGYGDSIDEYGVRMVSEDDGRGWFGEVSKDGRDDEGG